MKIVLWQLVLQSTTRYYAQGSIIADSREVATGLVVITSGRVGVELPMDSDEADEENRTEGGSTLLYVFSRGYAALLTPSFTVLSCLTCLNTLLKLYVWESWPLQATFYTVIVFVLLMGK